MLRYFLLFFLSVISGCLGPVRDLYPEDPKERPVPVYVISHGWHVGLVVESSAIRHNLPAHPDMPGGSWLTFGWGDSRYYPHEDPGFGLLLRAALLPTRSVIHVAGTDVPPEEYFPRSTIIKIQVSSAGAERLSEFLSARFKRSNNGNIRIAADGLYENSIFFEATGLYFIPKTSNTWTARALRKTGYPVTPFYAITSGNVIRQAKKEGEVIRE